VISGVYNDTTGIQTALSSIDSIDFLSEKFEVLAVDNNSTDNTASVIRSFAANNGNIYYLSETEEQSSYAARNTGIRAAQGNILTFIDADMTVPESWLSDLTELFSKRDVDYVGFDIDVYVPKGKKTLTSKFEMMFAFPIEQYLDKHNFTGAGTLAVHRNVINEVGLFDSTMVSGGDKEFGERVADAGFTQYFADHITVRHPARTSIVSLGKKAFRTGRGKQQLYDRHPTKGYSRPYHSAKNYLPPNPRRYLETQSEQGLYLLPAFYLIATYYKMCSTAGRVYQKKA
jgi:glycosyltransferase involved in cell wall biosynthesis